MSLGPIRGAAMARPALPLGSPVKGAIVGLWAAAEHSIGCCINVFIAKPNLA